jgi:hypothetical protein
MRRILWLFILVFGCQSFASAQDAGNRSYGTQRRKPQVNSGVLTAAIDGKGQVYFIETNVLMNMKADAYVAVFGLVQDGATSAESNSKVNQQASFFF